MEVCVDTNFSPLHCGGCNMPCATGATCVMGSCEASCPAGFTCAELGMLLGLPDAKICVEGGLLPISCTMQSDCQSLPGSTCNGTMCVRACQ